VSLSRTQNAVAKQGGWPAAGLRACAEGPWNNHARYDNEGKRTSLKYPDVVYSEQGSMLPGKTMTWSYL